MITFIRKISQQLITNNKVKKYIIFALDKIPAALIDSSLILQVNKWKKPKKMKMNLKRPLINMLSQGAS